MNRDRVMGVARLCAMGLTVAATMSCADKGVLAPSTYRGKATMQVTITANQQATLAPRFLIAAAGYDGVQGDNNGGGFLGASVIPFVSGTHTLSVPVNLAPCLAYFADHGINGCQLLIGAAIVPDTLFLHDTTGNDDPFKRAFDYYFAGPFLVGPAGALPTVPPIDLSASRFGVVDWQDDDALRLGKGFGGNYAQSPVFGSIAPIAGAVSGTGAPVIFALGRGVDNAQLNATNFQPGQVSFWPTLQIFENGQWRAVAATAGPPIDQTNGSGAYNDVTALSATEVYMSGPNGLWKYDGTAISKVAAVTGPTYSVGSATVGGTKYVIAGTDGGVWIGNGLSMTRSNLPSNARADGVCITGPNEAFASQANGGGLFRWDGAVWNTAPSSLSANKFDLECPGPGQIFVLAQGATGGLLKWTGTGWQTVGGNGLGPGRLIRWGVVSANEIYAYADSGATNRAFYKFNGTSWTEVGRSSFTQAGGRMWADPRGGAAYLLSPFDRLEKVTPSGYSVLSYSPSIRDAIMTSTTSAFAVGWNLFLARFDGAKWTVDPPPAGTPSVRLLTGVWSDGPKNAWAVAGASTILRYDGTSWVVVSDANRPIVAAGEVYNAVWGSGTDVWIAGNSGVTRCKAVNACAAESGTGGAALYSIWGSSPSNIFAVGFGGKILRYNGASWSPMTSPATRPLLRVAGSGPSDVWAVGDSVLVHFDGNSWTVQDPSRDSELRNLISGSVGSQNPVWYGLWARGPKEVYLGTRFGAIGRFDGTRWNQIGNGRPFGRPVVSISGPATGCGLAVNFAEAQSIQGVLSRGVGPTGCLSAPMVAPTAWP